jgi:hypothetical protein
MRIFKAKRVPRKGKAIQPPQLLEPSEKREMVEFEKQDRINKIFRMGRTAAAILFIL